MDADTEKTAKPRRRGLRFSLRTLLIVVTVLSVPLGWIGWRLQQVRRERATIIWIEKMGGNVSFHHQFETDPRSWWKESTDRWFGERVGYVNLHHPQVSDLSPLTEFKNLKVLDLGKTQVSDLSPLAELKNLSTLYLGNTQVSDLSPLAALKNLESLNLSNTQLSNLSPLAELKNLEKLWLSDTQVSDVSPLAALKNLKWLSLYNTQVSDEQVQELRQALPNCDIQHPTSFEE